MENFTSQDFKVGMFLKLNKAKVKIIEIKHPYAVVELPSISETLGRFPRHTINLTGFSEADIIDVDSLQTEESLMKAELEDLLD